MCLPLPIIYFTEVDRTKTGPVKTSALPDAESVRSDRCIAIANSKSDAIATSEPRAHLDSTVSA
jgi:hypothetical protein